MGIIAREYSESGLYHIVFKGVNSQDIFEESADYVKLQKIIKELKENLKFEIYVYCFMTNHVHLLLKENNTGEISVIMKRILTRYVMYYNRKYKRSGALIANRYKSQPLKADEYFLNVVRYIHQNPLKAHMVGKIEEYPWSSYGEYTIGIDGIADKQFIEEMLSQKEFIEYHQAEEKEIFVVNDKLKNSDESIRREIIKNYGVEPKEIGKKPKDERNAILRELKCRHSIRQIERLTGISRGVVHKS